MLSDCDRVEAECIFILIDNGIVSDDVGDKFMECMFHNNFEMYIFTGWLLKRCVLLRKCKYDLPMRKQRPCGKHYINLPNLINSDST